jgi:hypothetical protein
MVPPLIKNCPHSRKARIFYRVQKRPPLTPILSQMHLVHTLPSDFLKIQLNIVMQSASRSSKYRISFRFPHQNPVSSFCLLRALYMPYPSHPHWFYHLNNICLLTFVIILNQVLRVSELNYEDRIYCSLTNDVALYLFMCLNIFLAKLLFLMSGWPSDYRNKFLTTVFLEHSTKCNQNKVRIVFAGTQNTKVEPNK